VTQKNGERLGARARAYVHPIWRPPAQFARLRLRRKRAHPVRGQSAAVGVDTSRTQLQNKCAPAASDPLLRAAFQTPQLLLLSGVATAPRLPGTASQPRIICPASGKPAGPSGFIFAYLSTVPIHRHVVQRHRASASRHHAVRRERRGPMTSNFAECGGFLKTSANLDIPDIRWHFGMVSSTITAASAAGPRLLLPCLTCCGPKSRGSVSRSSSADPLFARPPRSIRMSVDMSTTWIHRSRATRPRGAMMETPALRGHCKKRNMFTADIETRPTTSDPRALSRVARRHRVSPGRPRQDGDRCSCPWVPIRS